jgi:hypothetical protein
MLTVAIISEFKGGTIESANFPSARLEGLLDYIVFQERSQPDIANSCALPFVHAACRS